MESLLSEGVDTIFGYPGGQIMPVYDAMFDYTDRLNHVLVRHEQGAVHAAQGYARATGRPGVVTVTSGPGATNVITGIADAMIDSTPIVVIAGQVNNSLLGTDAFQETDFIGMTGPISKWNYQIRRPEDIAWAVARAFYIAGSGRPGPVVLDVTRDAQIGKAEFKYQRCNFIRSYVPKPTVSKSALEKAAAMINKAQRPLLVFGQGIILSGAEEKLAAFLDKTGMPAASTMLGLSALPSDCKHYLGMLGMHGSVAPNIMTQKCDLLIAVGMRFDNRVTGKSSVYAKQASIIHIDIDAAEIGKIIPVDLGILGDASEVLEKLTALVDPACHEEWEASAGKYAEIEFEKVIKPEVMPTEGTINMGEAIAAVTKAAGDDAIFVTDVGQNQMSAARYSRFVRTRSFISSGGLGTMGFGLPAAIGAKVACPDRHVVAFLGDGGLQMTVQELGTIMQENLGVKVVLLNNNWLGNVRQWQELFFDSRYSYTRMVNPCYGKLAESFGIKYKLIEDRADLQDAVVQMLSDKDPWILDIHVTECGMVFPMIPPGKAVDEIMLNTNDWL